METVLRKSQLFVYLLREGSPVLELVCYSSKHCIFILEVSVMENSTLSFDAYG